MAAEKKTLKDHIDEQKAKMKEIAIRNERNRAEHKPLTIISDESFEDYEKRIREHTNKLNAECDKRAAEAEAAGKKAADTWLARIKAIEAGKDPDAVAKDGGDNATASDDESGDDDIVTDIVTIDDSGSGNDDIVDVVDSTAKEVDTAMEEALNVFNKLEEEIASNETSATSTATTAEPESVQKTETNEAQAIADSMQGVTEVVPNNTCRFEVKTPYKEKKFLAGVLDNIFAKYPEFSYELREIEEMPFYSIAVSFNGVETDRFIVDPRYNFGLGIPAIALPIAGVDGSQSNAWVPLGCSDLLKQCVFKKVARRDLGTILPIQYTVPEAMLIRSTRVLWPDHGLYEELDMSAYQIRNGQKYQDFGYYAWHVINTLFKKNGIHGKYRPVKINAPDDFELISDRRVVDITNDNFMPLDIDVVFKQGKIYVKSLLNNQAYETDIIIEHYPPIEKVAPMLTGETAIVQFQSTVKAPDPISRAWKQMAKVKLEDSLGDDGTDDGDNDGTDDSGIDLTETISLEDAVSEMTGSTTNPSLTDEAAEKIMAQWNNAVA